MLTRREVSGCWQGVLLGPVRIPWMLAGHKPLGNSAAAHPQSGQLDKHVHIHVTGNWGTHLEVAVDKHVYISQLISGR